MSDINEIISQSAIDGLLKAAQAAQVLDSAITAINKSQSSLAEKTKMLNDTQKEAEKLTKEQAKTLADLDRQRKKAEDQLTRQNNKEAEQREIMDKEAKTMYDLQKQISALTAARNKLDITTKDGAKAAQEYNKRINENTEKIRANTDAASKQRMNIGNYGSALKDVGSKVLAFASGLGIAVGAMGVFKAIMSSTESISDSFARNMEGLKDGFSFLARSVANLNFTNLIQGFRDAFTEGKRYADVLDEIEDRQRALGIATKEYEGQILDQKLILKSNASSIAEKEAAIAEIIRLEKLKVEETNKISNQDLDNELQNAAQKTLGVKEATEEQKQLILDFVSASGDAYDEYQNKLTEAAKLEADLNKLIKVTVDDRGRMSKDTRAYNAALEKLTPSEKELLDLLKISNNLTGDKRDLIAQAAGSQIDAVNQQKQALLGLEKFENQLRNEYLKAEDQKQKAVENTAKLAGEAAKVAEANIKGFEAALNSGFNHIDESIDNTEANIKGFEDAMSLGSVFSENADQFEASLNTMKDNLKGFEDAMAESGQATTDTFQSQFDRRLQIAQEYTQQVSAIGQTLLDFNQFLIDTEVQKMEQAKAYELQMAGDNAAKREAIEKKYDKEATKLKIKQAKQDKAAAIFKGLINVALAVTNMLSSSGPLGFIMAALAAAIGAVQVGIIASQPIPQFAKGTKKAPKGLAWIGERGQELIFGKDGVMMSPGQATLMNLKGGERILSNQDTKRLMAAAKGADDYYSRKLLDQMHADNLQLIETVKNKPVLHIDRKGNRISDRPGFRTYLDRKL